MRILGWEKNIDDPLSRWNPHRIWLNDVDSARSKRVNYELCGMIPQRGFCTISHYLKPLFGPKISAETDLGDFKLCFNLFNPLKDFLAHPQLGLNMTFPPSGGGLVIWPTRLLTGWLQTPMHGKSHGKIRFLSEKNWGGHGCAPSHGTFHLGYWW